MKKFLSLAALLIAATLHAQEGMWMLNTLKQINEADMQRMGCKLTADQIYDINNSSMKDGVVRLGGGFCSGEMVSAEGLMLTNHHCGFDAIQSHSSVEHDYLTDGFWAMTREQELPAEFYVSFLQRIDNVTEKVLATVNDNMTEVERKAAIRKLGGELEKEAEKDLKNISADFKSMYDGNEFYIFVYKDYQDVRLVGAPPSAIGKFGGDTDNWMWPRHTGDFSMFRVYMGPDGEPAPYAKENIPYKPKWHFPISLNGMKQGDFAMVMGCPGRTNRFMSSHAVDVALSESQPSVVKVRTELLDIMKQDMNADPAVRIKYASKYASIANYWKYFIGQQRGLKRLHVYDKKKQQETDLMSWINADAGRKAKYGEFLSLLEKGFAERKKYEKAQTYMNEAAFGSEAVEFAFNMAGLKEALATKPVDAATVAAQVAGIKEAADAFYKDYNASTDQKITAAMYRMLYNDVDKGLQPDIMATIQKKYKGDFDAWAVAMFKTSVITDRARLDAFLAKPTLKALQKDMVMHTMESDLAFYKGKLNPALQAAQPDIDKGYRLMLAAMREREPNRMWYPNANSTIRCSYGQVGDYKPGDAMQYDFVTTADGILEKEDNTNDEFVVPAKQHELLVKREYGRYADANGELVTCFISKNDITGGNSGSPVINGNGELIGIAFDGNWEAMSGDIAFEPELQRTISVDIRYVLWTIDVFAGATHLVNEMTIAPAPTVKVEAGSPMGMMTK
ncbi:MAG: S46 family peptidase [Flavobacteriales bacterium]|nr:S46 family peptidase [Flavobacteriales bacterium]MBK9195636.1 S46 family peptidase [Flavobacteriales bacterium]MBP6573162.1 S46 family peptidase [Flavobacteriales bacterium]